MSPLNSLSSNKNLLACCTSTDNKIMQWGDLGNDCDNSLLLKLLLNLVIATPENSNDFFI